MSAPAPPILSPPPFRAQVAVLTERYRATLAGDWPTVVLLVAQAPFIGWLCTLVWSSVETDTPSLYFVLCLSAVWFGCISACREVVKERAIVERERLLGLSPAAYVISKFRVLAWLALAQVVLLQGAVEWTLALKGPLPVQTLALWLAAMCGTGLGLLVSSIASRQDRAVGAVPLLILPQILFSEFAVPRHTFGRAVEVGEDLMPVRWAYRVFTALAEAEADGLAASTSLGVLVMMTGVLGGLCVLALLPRREDP